MAYCSNCGTRLADNAKYCQKCGQAVSDNKQTNSKSRKLEFEGKVYKCPNCGEVLHSFVRNCPACGLELRETNTTSAVREFALKLEAIEARREYEKPHGFFSSLNKREWISKTDEQKISLIQNFTVPNTKEDMLEFMILASSIWDSTIYGATEIEDKARKAIADAWLSKIEQVYAKAKNSYGNDNDFRRIEDFYIKCVSSLRKQKKKRVIKWILLCAYIPIGLALAFYYTTLEPRIDNKKEEIRLEAIVIDIENAMETGEYKLAFLNAESIEYRGHDKERARWWGIKRETLIDSIVQEAYEHGIYLQGETESGEIVEDTDRSEEKRA